MAIITLPSIAKFDDMQFVPQFRNQVNRSAWTGARKVMGLPGGECFKVSCAPRPSYTHSADRLWRAFIMALRGTENRFRVPCCNNQFPASATNPNVATAVAGASTATLTGIPTGGIKAGMYGTFALSNGDRQLVVFLADAAAGSQTVVFEPALRRNAIGAVEVKNPYAEVAMVKDNTGWSIADGKFMVAFEAEEAF